MSDRVKELAERERRLQERCAAQRASIAHELAAIEERFDRFDRLAGLARSALLHPAVIGGGVVALLAIARMRGMRGMRFVGRVYLLGTAARRLIRVVRSLPRAGVDGKQGGQV